MCSLDVISAKQIQGSPQLSNGRHNKIAEIAQMAKPIHKKYSILHNILITNTPGAFASDRMIETHISISYDKPVWLFVGSREEAEELLSMLNKENANNSSEGT